MSIIEDVMEMLKNAEEKTEAEKTEAEKTSNFSDKKLYSVDKDTVLGTPNYFGEIKKQHDPDFEWVFPGSDASLKIEHDIKELITSLGINQKFLKEPIDEGEISKGVEAKIHDPDSHDWSFTYMSTYDGVPHKLKCRKCFSEISVLGNEKVNEVAEKNGINPKCWMVTMDGVSNG